MILLYTVVKDALLISHPPSDKRYSRIEMKLFFLESDNTSIGQLPWQELSYF